MVKMVASDLDGTLLNSHFKITDETIKTINMLKEKGIKFVVATGRPEHLIMEYVDKLKLDTPYILNNGSVIKFFDKNIVLQNLKLKETDVTTLVEFCEKRNILYMLYTDVGITTKMNFRVKHFLKLNEYIENKENQFKFNIIENINSINRFDNVNKILIIEKDIEKFEELKKIFSSYRNFIVFSSQNGFLDINPLNTSKGEALKIVINYYGFSQSEVVVFGDQENDISMLKLAGKSIAVDNALELVKKVCDDVTLSNEGNGVSHWINKKIL